MLLKHVGKLMIELRSLANVIRPSNKNISEWVATYLNDCVLNGRPVTILTQWCVSKDLELRFEKGGQQFRPTKAELKLFAKEIPNLLAMFERAGLRVSWNITFNRSYLDSGRVTSTIEQTYVSMIRELARPLENSRQVFLFDWEEDILGERPKSSQAVLTDLAKYVPAKAFELELERQARWANEEAGLDQENEEIRRDVVYQIACEAEEGRWLTSADSMIAPNGQFLIIPLEAPERYDFFRLLAPDFKQRIVSVVHLYPWRVSD